MIEYEKDQFDIMCEIHRRKNGLCIYGVEKFINCDTQCKAESTCPMNPFILKSTIQSMR